MIDELYVVGINTDYCVFASAQDAHSRHRLKTYVVTDACSAAGGPDAHQEGVIRLRNHLGRKSTIIKENVTYS